MSSSGQFYDGYLKKIKKNTDPIDWKSIDVTYLIKVFERIFLATKKRLLLFRSDMTTLSKLVLMLVL